MNQLMSLVPIEAAGRATVERRNTKWNRVSAVKNKNRWGEPDDKPYLPPPFLEVPPGLTPAELDQFLREHRHNEIFKKLAVGEYEMGDPDIRPASPPPVYDKNGGRINTRDVRVKQAMTREYNHLVEHMIQNVPGFTPPSDFKAVRKIKRIEIPLEKFPEYNFMGLIIGPRGCNHKRLEGESNCQISIRGRGTQKDGKRDHQSDEEAQMPMHVHISGDDDESIEKAVYLIEPLLDPYHPMHEEFKKKGLEQLALVNGVTLGAIDTLKCAVCSAIGHLAADCPDTKELQSFTKPTVVCAICGDKGHVTMDCKLAGRPDMAQAFRPPPPTGSMFPGMMGATNAAEKMKMDMEYRKMMNELSGDGEKTEKDDASSVSPAAMYQMGLNGQTPPPGFSPIGPFMGSPPPPPPMGESPGRPGTRPPMRPGLGFSPMPPFHPGMMPPFPGPMPGQPGFNFPFPPGFHK